MSEEEEIIFEDPEPSQGGEEEEEEAELNFDEMDPLDQYEYAKSFDVDLQAVDYFYKIYENTEADQRIRAKSLKRASIILSQFDDFERTFNSARDVFAARSDGIVSNELCSKVVRQILSNLIRNEQALSEFLDLAAENTNNGDLIPVFIDVKLRQAELALKKADYNTVKDYLKEVTQYVPIPPDNDNRQMCNAAVRILFLQIELTDSFTQDEDQIYKYYEELKKIYNVTLTDRQTAVMNKIEGIENLKKKNFAIATQMLKAAFDLFDSTGCDKRIDCLPFLALSIMCSKDKQAMEFMDPKINPFVDHPIVSPLNSLIERFRTDQYVGFLNLLDSAQKVFQQKAKNAKPYFDLLDQVRLFVLKNNIKDFCVSYKKVQFSFLASELKCPIEEIKKLVLELIVSNELQALIDKDANLIIIKEIQTKSVYLENVGVMISAFRDTISRLTRRERILDK